MTRALVAMTAWAAATALDQDQAGGQERGMGLKVFELGLEMPANESGMLGDFHKGGEVKKDGGISDIYTYLSDLATKIGVAKK